MEDNVVQLFLEKFNLIDKRFDRLEGKIEFMENKFEKRFDDLDRRLDTVEAISKESLYKVNSLIESSPVIEEMLQEFAKANGLEYKV